MNITHQTTKFSCEGKGSRCHPGTRHGLWGTEAPRSPPLPPCRWRPVAPPVTSSLPAAHPDRTKVILSLTVCQMLISLTTISQRSSRNSAWSHLVFQLSPTWSLTRFSLNSALDYQKQLAPSEKNITFFEQTRNLFRLVTNCFRTYFLRISGEMLKK